MQEDTAELSDVERILLTPMEEEKPLEWVTLKADNLLVRSLKEFAGLYAFTVKKEVETMEKDIKQARKVFNGR